MTHQVRNIDQEIQQAKEAIAMGDALAKLEKNRDFKKLVTEGFLRDFALENLYFRGVTGVATDPKLAEANMRKLDSVAELKNFFRGVQAHAERSRVELPEMEATRVDILNEVDADE